MPPIAYSGSAEAAIERLKQVIASQSNAQLVVAEGNYIRAEFKSTIFGFIDDVEFLVDAQQSVILFRSASRVGYSDLGANRRRMKRITAAFGSGK